MVFDLKAAPARRSKCLYDNRLTGGTGADIFSFGSLATGGLDIITDFNRYAGDKISVSAAAFGGGLTRGLLDAGKFVLGAIATDANDRFLYNRSTGALSFDIDSGGGRSAVQFTKLSNGVTLSHSDFTIT